MGADRRLSAATLIMTSGGDGRIVLDPLTGLNRYHSAPVPRTVLAYASSTANDISTAAFNRVGQLLVEIGRVLSPAAYTERLEALRRRIRTVYGIDADVDIVFAPSGTDLEYVGIACVAGRGEGVNNLLLGADEVGSGCIHSAHGRYFADETALGIATMPGEKIPGSREVALDLLDIPVRDPAGRVRPSSEIAAWMDDSIALARTAGRHSLVHAVHGSKTGLILPALAELDRLSRSHGEAMTILVDACQARITGPPLRAYLARGAIVFVTGSKFMGGPPFSGFALVPARFRRNAPPLPAGFATLFRRAEWPAGWAGAEALDESANPGLLLRLEASIFELERFQQLGVEAVTRIILAFHAAIREEIIGRLPVRRVAPYPPGAKREADTHPIEMRTLSTLDLSALNGTATFQEAQVWHKAMLAHGVRLGQPVKCVRGRDGNWGATLRIGLAMWQIVERAALDDAALGRSFGGDMARVRGALAAVSA